ncbi:MAG: nitrate- and nitrite sensing domain-containing protein [Spirochaetaceae bacterium]
MTIFDRTKFRTKLLVMLALPLFGLLFFSIDNIIDRYRISTEMKNLENLTDLSIILSTLVHETQKERGRTATFLGSHGTKFTEELPEQRKETDVRITELNRFLENFDLDKFDNKFKTLLDEAMNRLDSISLKRSSISELNMSGSDAISYYTDMNSSFLNVIAYGTNLSTNAKITARLFSFVNFLQAKERAGIERAILSNTFAQDKFDKGMFQKVISLIAMQDAYLENYLNTATLMEINFYNQLMTHDSVGEVARMRTIAIENANRGNFGVDSAYWFDAITAKINQLKEVDDFLAEELIGNASGLETEARLDFILFGLLTLLILILTTLVTVFLINRILKQLGGEPNDLEAITKVISDGDLSLKKESGKKYTGIMKHMLMMSEKLKLTISGTIIVAEQISSACSELATGNQDLSNRTEVQAIALEETAAAIEEMNASIKSNSENASAADNLAREALSKTEDGSDAVNSMIDSINDISISSNRIADIIEVINNIAFQTNLLALNASIEAARAGIQGKGFAVVAVEVRKLAKKSDKAASEIANIIKVSNKKVEDGVAIANKAGNMLQEINQVIKKVTIMVGEVSSASAQQLNGINQIDQTLSSLDENTQKNAALVEEAASATEELSAQAIEMDESMKFFKLD